MLKGPGTDENIFFSRQKLIGREDGTPNKERTL
jgi:hypothetical protein